MRQNKSLIASLKLLFLFSLSKLVSKALGVSEIVDISASSVNVMGEGTTAFRLIIFFHVTVSTHQQQAKQVVKIPVIFLQLNDLRNNNRYQMSQ